MRWETNFDCKCRGCLSSFHTSQTLQHRPSRCQIESSDAVHRQHCGTRIQISGSLNDMSDTLHSSTSGECILERRCRPFDGCVQLLRHCAIPDA